MAPYKIEQELKRKRRIKNNETPCVTNAEKKARCTMIDIEKNVEEERAVNVFRETSIDPNCLTEQFSIARSIQQSNNRESDGRKKRVFSKTLTSLGNKKKN